MSRRGRKVDLSGALILAATEGRVADIDRLVQSGAVIDAPSEYGRTAMHAAASLGHLPVIEALIRLGSQAIDAFDKNGATPLLMAASAGHASTVEALVRLGSKAIDTPDNSGWTPMYWAAYNGHASTIEALVRLGSKAIDTLDFNGRTPMFEAAFYGHVSVIETLVRLGSNALDRPGDYGRTPLHAAALNGQVSAIETLVRLGSNAIDTPDQFSRTPADTARKAIDVAEICHVLDEGFGLLSLSRVRSSDSALKTLAAVGAKSAIPTAVDEDFTAEVRYRVYFADSLVHRLLLALDVAQTKVSSPLQRLG